MFEIAMLSLCRPYFRSILLFEIDQHALPCLLIELLWLILLAMSTLQQTIDVNHPEQNMSRRFIHNKCYSDTSQNDSKSNRYNSKKTCMYRLVRRESISMARQCL